MYTAWYKKIVVLGFVFILIGCAIHKEEAVQNKNNQTAPFSIRTSSSKDPHFKSNQLVYLKMNNHSMINSDVYEDELMKYLIQRKLFRKIITRSPSLYINLKPEEIVEVNDQYWFDRTDPLNNAQITKYFLKNRTGYILEAHLQGETMPSNNQFNLTNQLAFWVKLIDPKDKKTLFYARSISNNTLKGLYKPVFDKLADRLKRLN